MLRQVLAGNYLASVADQQGQEFGGLRLEFYRSPVATQFSAAKIHLEPAKANWPGRNILHKYNPPSAAGLYPSFRKTLTFCGLGP